jgi:beta-lactamase class D
MSLIPPGRATIGGGLIAALALSLAAATPPLHASATTAVCVIIGAAGTPPTISGAEECDHASAPASTFKIPHALLALQFGVITPATVVEWNGTATGPVAWRRSHTVASAIRWSVVPFFQHTARRIGAARMRQGLSSLGYAADDFDGDVSSFWLNGDLVVTPREQFAFLERFVAGRLPIAAVHVATVREALLMPDGQVTNASGTHDFRLAWPGAVTARVKTGNTEVTGERVSWLIGDIESRGTDYVVVARVRGGADLDGAAGLEAARRGLDTFISTRGRP